MIKKIDANEYGVVKYVITSVDELNRLPKKIAPSSQAILIENGLKVFVYGDGQWVEEVVDGDLSENMRSIVADYERSKIGYDGVKRGSLEERLKDDFQGLYDILNARDYCEYSGKELKVDNTWMGNQIDTKIEGRTLQNLINNSEYKKGSFTLYSGTTMEENEEYFILNRGNELKCSLVLQKKLLKPNTKYTLILSKKDVNAEVQIYDVVKESFLLTKSNITRGVFTTLDTLDEIRLYFLNNTDETLNSIKVYKNSIMILEGDHTQTPLSELPYFEGIESVGEREIGKNLLDPSELEYGSIEDGAEANKEGYIANRKRSGFMKVKPNTDYVFSSNLDEPFTNWWFYDINKKYISKETYSRTTTTSSNCEYIRVHNGHTDGTPLSDFKLQVEEGTVATEHEPFGYIIKGKSCGKNLLDLKKDYFVLGTYSQGIPMVLENGKELSDYSFEFDTNSFKIKSDSRDANVGILVTKKIKQNTQYVISTTEKLGQNTPNVRVLLLNSYEIPYTTSLINGDNINMYNKRFYASKQLGEKTIVEFNSGTFEYVAFYIGGAWVQNVGQAYDYQFEDIQLEESPTLTPYEPYQESTYSIHSPIPLRSLPNGVCDVYDFESGAVIQRVGKVVLDGSENWLGYESYDDDVTKWFQVDGLIKANNRFLSCISDKFICVMSSTHTLTGVGEVLSISPTSNGRLNLRINKDKLSSLDVNGFKLWLQTNPTTVYYELEEPIIHYLTPSQLKSFDGTTHVISENTLIPTTITKILTDTYANVSNVNSTAYSLKRGVNDVAETSAIINETDVEQDDVLDVTMCAIDELYSMLEPNLE